MKTLQGSCHCGKVRFTVQSRIPVPYARCYCSICRKTAGGGGAYAVNVDAYAKTLKVKGMAHVATYRARLPDPAKPGKTRLSGLRRHFCKSCGSPLWAAEPHLKDYVMPFASAIDTPMEKPKALMSIMHNYAAPWVALPHGKRDITAAEFPSPEASEKWQKKHGYLDEIGPE